MKAWPCRSSCCYQGHKEGTQVIFSCWFFFLASSSKEFAAWLDPLLCADLAGWWHSPDWLLFLFWWFPSPCVWNISSAVSRNSHNSMSSVRPWVAELNPWMVSSFCHYFGSDKSTISRISYSGRRCPAPKGGNFSRYSTILSMRQIKYRILVSQGFYSPLLRYLFWDWSALGRK